MSTCQSLRLQDAIFVDSMESCDISMDCLSQKWLSHCRKTSKIGQQNPVGGRSAKAQLFTVSLVAVKEEDKRVLSIKEYLELSLQATGGCLRNILTYESGWCDWVTAEWNMWWTIWSLLTRWKEVRQTQEV